MAPIDINTNYLDFFNILQYEIVGSATLLFLLGLVLLAYFMAKYAVPYQIAMVVGVFYMLVVSALTGSYIFYSLTVFGAGALIYFMIGKLFWER